MTQTQDLVYLIDDDEHGRYATQLLLELTGWQVRSYCCAEDFLEELDRARSGCVLVDYRMSGMSGLQLFTHIREQGINWPTVMLSGHAEPPLIDAALAAGVAAFLLKPVMSADLRKCLREQFELLQRSQ